jgi:hypothetical protein
LTRGRSSRDRRGRLLLRAPGRASSRADWESAWRPIDFANRHLHDAADVAHDGLGLHRAEGDDLGDVLAAVLLGDVRDDLAAAALAEVDVDIRQRDAFGIEEALEVQIEVQRIDVGDRRQ